LQKIYQGLGNSKSHCLVDAVLFIKAAPEPAPVQVDNSIPNSGAIAFCKGPIHIGLFNMAKPVKYFVPDTDAG
jgi:hypothetical protein